MPRSYRTWQVYGTDGHCLIELDYQLQFARAACRFVGVLVEGAGRDFVDAPGWIAKCILAECNADTALLRDAVEEADAEAHEQRRATLADAARDEAASRELCGE